MKSRRPSKLVSKKILKWHFRECPQCRAGQIVPGTTAARHYVRYVTMRPETGEGGRG